MSNATQRDARPAIVRARRQRATARDAMRASRGDVKPELDDDNPCVTRDARDREPTPTRRATAAAAAD